MGIDLKTVIKDKKLCEGISTSLEEGAGNKYFYVQYDFADGTSEKFMLDRYSDAKVLDLYYDFFKKETKEQKAQGK